MATLKPFVQQAVRELELPQLQLLSETLRVDLRGCDDRADIERILTGLLCLDQDSSLGVFLGWWLQLNQRQHASGRRKSFQTTFVPAISPIEGGNQFSPIAKTQEPAKIPEEDRVAEHHLDYEISERLKDLEILERDFKLAERGVHTGSPSFDKLKCFLVALAQLRNKEEETRRFMLRQAKLLRAQHDDMQRETLHTRGQLDFFVAGFSNLRQRHDALLEKATRLAAENESAHALFVEMSAEDAHFALLATNTLHKQLADLQELRDQVQDRDEQLVREQAKQEELMKTISSLKQQRGDARKDAHCYKQQLRICKSRMKSMEQSERDASILRQQSNELRNGVVNLLSTHLRDAIQRDTKSAKQSLSKEALKIIQHITTNHSVDPPIGSADRGNFEDSDKGILAQRQSRKRPLISRQRDADSDVNAPISDVNQGHISKRQHIQQQDLTDVIKGVVLVGGDATDTVKYAMMLSGRLKYLAVDVAATIEKIRVHEEQNDSSSLSSSSTSSTPGLQPSLAPDATVSLIARFSTQLGAVVRVQLESEQKRGFVLHNWQFTSVDVDFLKAGGLSIDSIIDLQVTPPVQPRSPPPSAPKPIQREPPASSSPPKIAVSTSRAPTPGVTSRGKASTTGNSGAVSAKTLSPSKSTKAASSSPVMPTSRAPVMSGTKSSTKLAKAASNSTPVPTQSTSKPSTTSKSPTSKTLEPAKSPPKSPTKVPAKSPTKSPAKSPAKPLAKSPIESPAKTLSGKPGLSPTAKPAPTSPTKPTTPASPSRSPTSTSAKTPGSSSTSGGTKPSSPGRTPNGVSSSSGQPSPKQVQQPKRPTDQRAAFKTQLPLYQSIAPTMFEEERLDAIVVALEREKAKRLAPVIKWDEEGERVQEQLTMFGEEILTLLAVEYENRKPGAKRGVGGPSSSSASTAGSSSMNTSRSVASRAASRAPSPVKDATSPAKASKNSTAKALSPSRRPTELLGKSTAGSPPPPARRLTQQPTATRYAKSTTALVVK